MVPYIAALIVLIVAILFAVYNRVDGFEIASVTITKNTKGQEFYDLMKKYIQQNKTIKKMIEDSGEFDEENLTQTKLNDLAIGFSMAQDGKISLLEKPISKALKTALEREITEQEANLAEMDKKIASGEIKLSQTFEESSKGQEPNYEILNGFLNAMIKVSNAREAYVKSKANVGGVNVTDLYGAVGGVNQAIKASTLTEESDLLAGRTSTPAAAPATSNVFTKEVEERIAKSVATQLKDTLLAKRSTEHVLPDANCPYAPYQSDAVAQGQEYVQGTRSPQPDMSEYIRKDSIPCWNCSLP
jgi:hypothetical protein